MKRITAYKVSDGFVFEKELDAERYEKLKSVFEDQNFRYAGELAVYILSERERILAILEWTEEESAAEIPF